MTKKIFAMFLAVLMVVSVLPISAMAAEVTCPGKGTAHTIDNCKYTQLEVVAPGCGTEGFTYYKCNKCGDKFVGSPVPATGEHTFEPTEAKAPTCELPGNEAGLKCKDCGKLDAPVIPPLYTNAKCEWTEWSPAKFDCTVGGVRTRECKVCHAVQTSEPIEAQDEHVFGAPVLKTAATAEANGKAEQKCTNPSCDVKREVVVFFNHECVIEKYEEVAADCTTGTNGSEEYYACRICGVKYKLPEGETEYVKMTNDEIKDLVIKAEHAYADNQTFNGKTYNLPSCTNSTAYCTECEKEITVVIDHNYVGDFTAIVPATNTNPPEAPTCTIGGYTIYTCTADANKPGAGCGKVYTSDSPALGHKTITVSVPATCSAFAYTYTYCIREDCDSAFTPDAITNGLGLTINLPAVAAADDLTGNAKKAGSAVMTVNSGLGYNLFFNGVVADGKMSTTINAAEAVKINVKMVHTGITNAYYLYITNAEGGKSYIEAYKAEDGTVALRLTETAPTTYFKVNGGKLSVNFQNDANTYIFAAAKNDTSIALVKSDATKVVEVSMSKVVYTGSPLKLTACTVDVVGGYNDNAHTWNNGEVTTPHTHDQDGVKTFTCSGCHATKTSAIPAGHTWVPIAVGDLNDEGKIKVNGEWILPSKDPDCTEGYTYKKCSKCAEADVVTYNKAESFPGYGHKLGDLEVETPDHKNTTVYDHKDCEYCTYFEKVGEAKVWADSNKHYESYEHALAAHPSISTATPNPVRSATCTVYGLKSYACSECKKNVLVQIPTLHDPSGAATYDAPECDEEGSYKTFECATCKTVIGVGVVGQTINVIPELGHIWAKQELPEDLDCDSFEKNGTNPTYEKCTRCNETVNVFAEVTFTNPGTDVADTTSCTKTTMFVYTCKLCDGIHASNFPGKLKHEMVNSGGTVAPSCSEEKTQPTECLFCDHTDSKKVPLAPHVNAAGEEFYAGCQDTETDRHCVVCCTHDHDCTKQKDSKGKYTCECMIGNTHDYANTYIASTCLETGYTMSICKYCDAPKTEFSKLPWNGHTPVAVGEDGKHANYTYANFPVFGVKFVSDPEDTTGTKKIAESTVNAVVDAEFIEYVPASYTADGYWKGMCAVCNQEVTQVLPKYEGAGFVVEVANANGAEGLTFGSLVAVNISMNANNVNVFGFETDLIFNGEQMQYVGFQAGNGPFTAVVGEPKHNVDLVADQYINSVINIAGFSTNTSADNLINEKTEVVTLFFRVTTLINDVEEPAESLVRLDAETSKIYDRESYVKDTKKNSFVSSGLEMAEVEIRMLMDVNGDEKFELFDLFAALDLIENGKYDVTVDVDKDGVLTLADVMASYNYYVNQNVSNKALLEVFFAGMEKSELDMWKLLLNLVNFECSSSTCTYTHPSNDGFCPECGKPMQPITNP